MENFLFLGLFVFLGLMSVCAHWCDAKYGWNVTAWMHGEQNSPFQTEESIPTQAEKEKEEMRQLRERIQVLEKIVTEPSYELKRQIERC